MRDEEKGGDELPASNTPAEDIKDDPEYLVKWADGDPENPYNWKTPYKAWVTLQLSMLALAASATSSMIAPANRIIAEYIGVSETVAVLNVSLFVYASPRVAPSHVRTDLLSESGSALDRCYG
jgi:hypothetical protein